MGPWPPPGPRNEKATNRGAFYVTTSSNIFVQILGFVILRTSGCTVEVLESLFVCEERMNQLLEMINCCSPIEDGEKTRAQIKATSSIRNGGMLNGVNSSPTQDPRRGYPRARSQAHPGQSPNEQNGYVAMDRSYDSNGLSSDPNDTMNTSISQHQW